MSRDAERKNVLENVARLERENAELRARVDRARSEHARANEALEETVRVRPKANANAKRASTLRLAAAISAGLAFGLVTLAITLLLVPPTPRGHDLHDARGTSAGACR